MKLLLPGAFAMVVLVAAADPSKEDLDRMQGDWAAESMIRDGQRFPDEDAQAYFRTIQGNHYTVFRFTKAAGKGTLKLDATKNPKTIDFTPDGAKGPTTEGIYSIENDTLIICMPAPGKPRPTKMASEPDSGHTLSIWKREKK